MNSIPGESRGTERKMDMKITQTNSDPAPGYDDVNIRTCPRCHGDGMCLGIPNGGFPYEMICEICSGDGIATLTED